MSKSPTNHPPEAAIFGKAAVERRSSPEQFAPSAIKSSATWRPPLRGLRVIRKCIRAAAF